MKKWSRHLLRLTPLVLVIVAIWLVFHFGLNQYLSFEAIKTHKDLLLTWINTHYLLSVLFFMLAYIVVVALSIPGAVFLTLTAGFLFGFLLGTVYVVVAATVGATCIFLIVQFSLGQWLAEKNGTWVAKMQQGFQENALQYLLFLRLVPLFPFPVVNVVPGILNIKKSTYVMGTFFGIMPGSFVYAWLGHGLGYAFSTGQAPNLSIIFEPPVFWPLISLAALSLIPIAYKRLRRKRRGK
ncbi:MAG: TVP38/TMEM64 family protein [Francisellaceae bacterium]